MVERLPAAIVMDVDFCGPGLGLQLAAEAQEGLDHQLPLLFFSQEETDTPTRLAAVRAGGREFFTGILDASFCWRGSRPSPTSASTIPIKC